MRKGSSRVLIITGSIFLFSLLSSMPLLAETSAWVADPSSKNLENPLQGKKKSVGKGEKLFKTNCTVCHGASGLGDGPGGKALTPKPANLQSDRVQNQADGEIFWKISEGRGPMVRWKLILSEEDRWNLVNYLRTLKEN